MDFENLINVGKEIVDAYLIYSFDNIEHTELRHYGVLGMKWGIRNDRKKVGRERRSGKSNSTQGIRTTGGSKLSSSDSNEHILENFNNFQTTVYKHLSVQDTYLSDKARIKEEHSIEDDLSAVNPNYDIALEQGISSLYRNCHSASLGYEMRRRGFDVSAGPLEGSTEDSILKSLNKDSWDIESIDKTSYISRVDDMLDDGGRGFVHIKWTDMPNAHVFNVEKQDGNIRFIDAQNNNGNAADYLDKADNFKFIRTDNLLPLNDYQGPPTESGRLPNYLQREEEERDLAWSMFEYLYPNHIYD